MLLVASSIVGGGGGNDVVVDGVVVSVAVARAVAVGAPLVVGTGG